MNQSENDQIETLLQVLTQKFSEPIQEVTADTIPLHGGTLGNVTKISGVAKRTDGTELPFDLVHKTMKKWPRNFDENSWRREYDLYASGMNLLFDDSLRPPHCYYKKITEDKMQLWMEYVEGVSGLDLTEEMLMYVAKEWGRFQGKLFARKPDVLNNITNFSSLDFAKKNYLYYRSCDVYPYIRSENCDIPKHLCKMLIDIDEQSDKIWRQIESLPVVLCHRDFWVTNIIYTDGTIRLIDWDTAGWGYLGEDIASLIADDTAVEYMVEYYEKCIPAYYKGFSEYVDVSHISENCIWEMIIMMFGYRLVERYKFVESMEEKQLQLDTLQKIYEMRRKPDQKHSSPTIN